MVKPNCPFNYTLNKKTCRCNKVKSRAKPITKKKTMMKEKSKANLKPKTKLNKEKTLQIFKSMGEKERERKLSPVKSISPAKTSPAKSRKRCPNGTRKNKITGKCEKKTVKVRSNVLKEKNPLPSQVKSKLKSKEDDAVVPLMPMGNPAKTIIPQSNSVDIKTVISRAFQTIVPKQLDQLLHNYRSSSDPEQILSSVRKEMVRNKSFSPAVNKQLVSLRTGEHDDFFGCGLSLKNLAKNNFKIKVGSKIVNGQEKPKCVSSTSDAAKNLFINNLKRINTINCDNIIAPIQSKSNCWFNTMFMCFFISDKGRKFFRFFRQLMIEGKLANGTIIKPKKLRDALFLLNACIEASYNVSKELSNDALLMDTNNVIRLIYNSIRKKDRYLYKAIKKEDEAGNPLYYYNDIINFLGLKSIYIEKDFTPTEIASLFTSPKLQNNNPYMFLARDEKGRYTRKIFTVDETSGKIVHSPDICVLSLREEGAQTHKPMQFDVSTDTDKITYALDSIIVRDIDAQHFCSVLTCNGEEKAFDGASIGKLRDFKWKDRINKNENWSFSYGGEFSHYSSMKWNFTVSYQLLFYYRIK